MCEGGIRTYFWECKGDLTHNRGMRPVWLEQIVHAEIEKEIR